VLLQVGSFGSRLLCPRQVQRQTACDDQHGYRCNSGRIHVDLVSPFKYAQANPSAMVAVLVISVAPEAI
jgi:hypothetical protein